ncbi:MAG: cytochrome C oxidase subunit II [Spirochaetota bacterium]|nr:MAG: cytochrome C oxidase subunit II [Spirochaetota bacterium]
MAGELPRSPNIFHPTKPSAVGSRHSLAQEGRIQEEEFRRLIEEETDKVLKEIRIKLPEQVLGELEIMGGIKQKLYNYFNQNYQNMFNRYMVTTEDEMVKKIRDFVDKEELKTLARYTPKEIAQMLDQIGGADKFNTGEIEKSIVNMYGHLQGHVQRGLNDLENDTNSLLRQKTDVGAFIRGENAYSIVKCSFKDNVDRPKTVSDVKLSVNILDAELISPIFQYQATVEYLIKDQISNTLMDLIDRELERFKDQLVDEGKPELSDGEIMFEKMKRVPNYTDDDKEDEKSRRYTFMAKSLMDKIEGLRAEIDHKEFDPINIRETLKKIVDMENIRNRGFNTAINSLTSILDTSKMGYQYVENLKNARELILREYEDTDPNNLPDERYSMRLKYYDQAQLLKEREAYDVQMEEFVKEITHLWDVLEIVYQDSKSFLRVNDFDDIAKRAKNKIKRRIKSVSGDPLYEDMKKTWNEVMLIKAGETDVEKLNNTYLHEKTLLKKMLRRSREKLQTIYGYRNPKSRVILEDRITFLEREFEEFDYIINPYHIQPGVILDVDITSIKRKKYTLGSMANVLNEFLHGISKGFQDAAFASFRRRRSTMREDIDQSFAAEEPMTEQPGAYSESLMAEPAPSGGAPTGGGAGVKRKADVTPTKKKKTDLDELKEL